MNELQMSRAGFKAYDIRGRMPDEINEELAYRVGRAYADLYQPGTVAVGRDIRPSSKALSDAVVRGLADGGADVLDIGLCGTEMVYFASFYYGNIDGGLMITASHNPSDNNGIKIVRKNGVPVSADTGLKDIEALAFSGHFKTAERRGKVAEKDVMDEYIAHILSYVDVSAMKPLTILADAGNGCAGLAFQKLKPHLPFHFIEMYMEPDGTFPHGVPNPMLPENREPLIRKVKETGADLGIAWDGDFDRCFFIDHTGSFVEGYYMVGLLAGYFLKRHPGEMVVHDPRCFWNTEKIAADLGGHCTISKGGHAFMKETMRRVHGIYGAEMSAHHFFRDFSYCDSGMIPWLIVTEIMSETGKSLHELVGTMEKEFPCSGEINLPARDVQGVLQAVEKKYEGKARAVSHLDGVSIDFGNWRFNLRPSNTEPLIRFNMETRGDKKLLAEKREEVISFVKAVNKN